MKTVTCVMLFAVMLMMGGRCLADDSAENTLSTGKVDQVVELGVKKNSDQMRVWMDSIKPAAGHVEPAHPTTGYWDKSVRRESQGDLQK